MAKNYVFTVDLRYGGTTPSFLIFLDGKDILPLNTMPVLEKDDTITFSFKGREVLDGAMYWRPLANDLPLNPFAGQEGFKFPVKEGDTFTVDRQSGNWSFVITGTYQATLTFGHAAISIPFLIDPEADVGTGMGPGPI